MRGLTRGSPAHASAQTGQRQSLGQDYTMNGALYLFRWDYFKQHQWIYHDRETGYGYPMAPLYSVEIAEPVHLLWAEFLVNQGQISLADWRG